MFYNIFLDLNQEMREAIVREGGHRAVEFRIMKVRVDMQSQQCNYNGGGK